MYYTYSEVCEVRKSYSTFATVVSSAVLPYSICVDVTVEVYYSIDQFFTIV